MDAQESGGRPAYDKPTALARPENLSEPQTAVVNVPPQRSNTFTSRTFHAPVAAPEAPFWRKRAVGLAQKCARLELENRELRELLVERDEATS
jgi:hypothetical protein